MQLGKQKPMYYIGNARMALSFFSALFIYFPVIKMYFFPTKIILEDDQPYISIEKIHASAPLLFDIDPWDKTLYENALEKGVAHAKGSDKPGGDGTVYLFAHSSALPWEITRLNTSFFRLHELTKGDTIDVFDGEKKYTYKVREKKTIAPREIQYLQKDQGKILILQTCTPIGTDWNRLLVFADLVE
jgi:LPXTG-site transpeptidase (sortase) family protein